MESSRWQRSENREEWAELLNLIKAKKVILNVQVHNGVIGNEKADRFGIAGCEKGIKVCAKSGPSTKLVKYIGRYI